MMYTRILSSIILTAYLGLLLNHDASADDSMAGVVIVASGKFFATKDNQSSRVLKRRSKIYVGETLVTGGSTKAQVRFIDGAVISLRPHSELRIEDYRYSKDKKKADSSVLTLLKGGFRTITGAVGKENYKVQSSLATIGIRGTHYEAVIAETGFFVGVWKGGVTVKNQAGQIDLGMGADFNYARIQTAKTNPVGLLSAPAEIINTQPAIKAKQKVMPQTNNQLASGMLQSPDNRLSNQAPSNQVGNIVKLDQVGFAMFENAGTTNNFSGIAGKSTSGSSGSPVLSDNGYKVSDSNYVTAQTKYVLLQGTASTTTNNLSVGGQTISWGKWGTGAVLQDYTKTTDGVASTSTVNSPVYWLTAQPTQNMPSSGAVTFSNVQAFSGGGMITGGSQGDITGFTMTANVDYATGVISSGNMNFTTGSVHNWDVNFTGNLSGSAMNLTVNTSTSFIDSSVTLAGSIPAVVSGPNAEVMTGGFSLKSTGGGESLTANGIFVVGQ